MEMKEAEETEDYFERVTEAFTSACVLIILYPLCQTSEKLNRVFLSIEKATGSGLMSLQISCDSPNKILLDE